MDLFLAGCQGLGLALAAGLLLGSSARTGALGTALAALAALAGAGLFGASLTPEDHPAWPGWLVGAPAGLLAYLTARDVALGARTRTGGEAGAGVALYLALVALALAGLALAGPAALVAPVALVATVWLYAARRRKAAAKHAGLRSLR